MPGQISAAHGRFDAAEFAPPIAPGQVQELSLDHCDPQFPNRQGIKFSSVDGPRRSGATRVCIRVVCPARPNSARLRGKKNRAVEICHASDRITANGRNALHFHDGISTSNIGQHRDSRRAWGQTCPVRRVPYLRPPANAIASAMDIPCPSHEGNGAIALQKSALSISGILPLTIDFPLRPR